MTKRFSISSVLGAAMFLFLFSPQMHAASANDADTIPFHPDPIYGNTNASSSAALTRGFTDPPPSARPWVYWVWLNANTTHAALTRDLEQMKAKGIQGFIIYDSGAGNMWANPPKMIEKANSFTFVPTDEYATAHSTEIPTGHLTPWSDPWIDDMRFVADESARLGLKFCLAGGLADTSGAITQEYAKHKLVWTKTEVTGPSVYDASLPASPGTVKADPNVPGDQVFFKDVAVLGIPNAVSASPKAVVNLTAQMDGAGHLTWSVPHGSWTILRFSQVATGVRNDFGVYSDALNPEAAEKVFAVTVGRVLAKMTDSERKALIGIEDDSWESGLNTWTTNFPEQFQRRRGYDITPYLPILAGMDEADKETRAGFLRDYNLTISDLTADYHYGTYEKICHSHNLVFFSEAAGPNLHFADLYKTSSRVDMPMAEFWYPSYHRPTPAVRFLLRNAANTAHIYGFPTVMCESFTSVGPHWEETPFTMKPVADQAFCDGLNRVCFHNFSQSPSLTGKPGYVYFAGTHYEPGITWWDETPAFNDYLARCSYLLQQGKFVADALFYKGDNLGDGEPAKTIPETLGDGYDHDNFNTEVLLTRLSVTHGRLTLPDGMSYRVLVLPDGQPMQLDVLQKIDALLLGGAIVVGPPPTGLAGLQTASGDQTTFNSLVASLWGGLNASSTVVDKQVGAGRIISGLSVRSVLQRDGIQPDFEQSGVSDLGYIDWIHRRSSDADIYFVASRWPRPEQISATFRVSGRQPELWDPVTGEVRDASTYTQSNGRTTVPLQFNPCGSVFVVFRTPIAPTKWGTAKSNYPEPSPIMTIAGPWQVHFDQTWGGPGDVVFDNLVDWTTRPEDGIKYYSGSAVYRKTFDWGGSVNGARRVVLDLGELHEVCTIKLNGIDLGTVWTKPYQVNVTGTIRAQGNTLEVTVVNLWPNRLIGDELAAPGAPTYTTTNMRKFGKTTTLLPSGLIGPVTLLESN